MNLKNLMIPQFLGDVLVVRIGGDGWHWHTPLSAMTTVPEQEVKMSWWLRVFPVRSSMDLPQVEAEHVGDVAQGTRYHSANILYSLRS
jgi:hypothetical protein